MTATQIPPRFTEDWFGEPSQRALADLYALVADLDGDIIEVGSWEGRSTIALAKVCHPHTVHAVDTWQGSPGEVSAELAAGRDVLAQFTANVAAFTDGNVEPYRMGWREFFAGYTGKIKFCFIDATHTRDEVRWNIEAVLPHMVLGGVIAGDDVHHGPVQQGVLDVFDDALCVATLWWVTV